MNNHELAWTIRLSGNAIDHLEDFYLGMVVGKHYTQWESVSGKGFFSWRKRHDIGMVKLLGSKSSSLILRSPDFEEFPEIVVSTEIFPDLVPFVGWGNYSRFVGFYGKDVKIIQERESVFSGSISFLDKNPGARH